MTADLENSIVATGLEKISFHSNPKKKGNAKECWNYHTIPLSHKLVKSCSKFSKPGCNSTWTMSFQMFKLYSELYSSCIQQRNQRSNCQHPWDHQKSKTDPEKHLLLLIDYAKAFDCVDHNKLWKILKKMRLPDWLTYFLRNLYAGQEATVRTGHGKNVWLTDSNLRKE